MNEDKKRPDPSDAEIEREIRSQRKFSLAEAIGRNAGDLMKGASPVTRKQQAEFVIEELLEQLLEDAEGALTVVLLRRIKTSAALLADYDDPVNALATVIEGILASEERLERFVTRVDAEWGRIYSERPHFENGQASPDVDDPYTHASVRAALESLLEELTEGSKETS